MDVSAAPDQHLAACLKASYTRIWRVIAKLRLVLLKFGMYNTRVLSWTARRLLRSYQALVTAAQICEWCAYDHAYVQTSIAHRVTFRKSSSRSIREAVMDEEAVESYERQFLAYKRCGDWQNWLAKTVNVYSGNSATQSDRFLHRLNVTRWACYI